MRHTRCLRPKRTQRLLLAVICLLIILMLLSFMQQRHRGRINTRREDWERKDGQVYQNLLYDRKKGLAYDLYIPKKVANTGVILFIHGGGWESGSRKNEDFLARRYAKDGYMTATMDYSLISKEDTGVTVAVMLDDIENCIKSIKEKAAELGYPLTKVVLGGESAGAHRSLLYGYSRKDTSPLAIQFILDIVGPTDFHLDSWIGKSTLYESDEQVAYLTSRLSGQNITTEMLKNGQAEEILTRISPLTYVDQETVPTILIYGGKDTMVASCNWELLIEKLNKNQVKYDFTLLETTGHDIYNTKDITAYQRVYEKSLEYLQEY